MPNEIKDIAGLGEIVGHIKDLIFKFLEYRSQRDERQLKNVSLRLQNTREFLQQATDFNMTPEELKSYVTLGHEQNLIAGNPPYFSKSQHYSENS